MKQKSQKLADKISALNAELKAVAVTGSGEPAANFCSRPLPCLWRSTARRPSRRPAA